LLRSLVKSMVKRMKECVGVNGGKTKH